MDTQHMRFSMWCLLVDLEGGLTWGDNMLCVCICSCTLKVKTPVAGDTMVERVNEVLQSQGKNPAFVHACLFGDSVQPIGWKQSPVPNALCRSKSSFLRESTHSQVCESGFWLGF